MKLGTDPIDRVLADQIVESLRSGVPPRRGVSAYATGTGFAESVRKRHLAGGIGAGKIRFVAGSWGAGKTHFFRLLREYAFAENLLVSTVELSSEQTPFNKFERVFFEIVRNISSPRMYDGDWLSSALPFGDVLREALAAREGQLGSLSAAVQQLSDEILADTSIDIDFRRVVTAFWKTFDTEEPDNPALEDTRGTLLQWFEGEGQSTRLRRDFGLQKMVTKENARIILTSLGKFVKRLGYAGLLVLLDESEMTHSTMRKSSLKQAHNNLLHLINEVDDTEGLFLLYAAVPEFFNDPKVGIKAYGALTARIGSPEERPPKALEKVWNLDQVAQGMDDYAEAASKIRQVYGIAYPGEVADLPGDGTLRQHIAGIVESHPKFSPVSLWRVVITGTVQSLDRVLEGDSLPDPKEHHGSILDALQDD